MNHNIRTGWRKSSDSGGSGSRVEVAFTGWRKSSYSSANGSCVEVAFSGWHVNRHVHDGSAGR